MFLWRAPGGLSKVQPSRLVNKRFRILLRSTVPQAALPRRGADGE